MEQIGANITCDRCRKSIFVRKLTSDVRRDGKIYEELPGWEIIDYKNLCPECSKLYHKTLAKFWANEHPSR